MCTYVLLLVPRFRIMGFMISPDQDRCVVCVCLMYEGGDVASPTTEVSPLSGGMIMSELWQSPGYKRPLKKLFLYMAPAFKGILVCNIVW